MPISCSLLYGTRREGEQWLGFCPSVDVPTVADTKEEAKAAVREAVRLWVVSCAERGQLRAALAECGFVKVDRNPISHDVFEVDGETYWRWPDYLPIDELARIAHLVNAGPEGAPDDAPPQFEYQYNEPQELRA